MLFRFLIIFVLCGVPGLAAANTVAVCGIPAGLADYFRGEVLLGTPASWTPAEESHGTLSLIRDGKKFDLLLTEEPGGVARSARAEGANVEAIVLENGDLHHLRVEQDGYLDHFLFHTPKHTVGEVVWTSQRVNRDRTGTLVTAPCVSGEPR